MAMVVDVGVVATPAAAVVCKCKHGGASLPTSSSAFVVGMGGGHALPVCRGLRRLSVAAKRPAPVGFQARSSRSVGIVAEVQEAASPVFESPVKGSSDDTIQQFLKRDYKYGFVSDIESVSIPKGLSENTVRLISAKKNEPEWMLNFRLNAFKQWQKMKEPTWSDNKYPQIDFQDVCYYTEPKKKETKQSLDEVDPDLLETFAKLGIPLSEQKRLANVAVDAVFDSVSIATTHRKTLMAAGVIFCSISEAIREYPDLVKKHLGKVVPVADNYYAALNSAVFSDGSFCYVPKDTVSPMEISTYFRINAMETGQFERTLIVCDENAYVSYLEGCTAPAYDKNQLHAAVVELYCASGAEIKYSTVQNWYAGDSEGKGGIYNFVTKRGLCDGAKSKISWTQVETGSAITWKYPSVVLKGDGSIGEFYSVALTNNKQQADTGTKMIHVGKNTRSRIVSKGISAGNSVNCYRGLVQVQPSAHNARNFSQCDSMLIGDQAGANTYPYITVKDPSARVEHEASTSKIGEDQLFYFQQRGIDAEKAVAAIIGGFCREVFKELPLEFAAEVNQLMSLKLEGSVG
jgi:FeS assembly protein SufB